MKTDLLLLTLLYAVALTAFVGAINAHGPARVALSYFLAIICLCAAVFNTSQYLAAPAHEEGAVLVPPPAPTPPPKPEPPPPPPGPDSAQVAAQIAASQAQQAAAESKNELKSVEEGAARVLKSLGTLNLGGVSEVSDEEYEAYQNRAVGYLSEARKVKERFTQVSSKVPASLNDAKENLGRGIESLIAAAYNAERFFKSENDTEEKERLANYRAGRAAATAALRKAGSQLGSGDNLD
jgi:hypothetical protein